MPKRKKARRVKGIIVPNTKMLEGSYYSKIYNSTLIPILKQLKDRILPDVKNLVEEFKAETDIKMDSKRFDVSYGKKITRLFQNVGVQFERDFEPDRDVKEMEARANKFNEKAVDKQMKTVIGVDPFRTEKWRESQTEAFVEENVSLIKTIPSKFFPEIEELVRRRVSEGVSTTKIKLEIMKKFQSTKKRAKLIARDQINKYHAKLNELRQRESGIEKYIWKTVGDERVRGKKGGLYPNAKPSHAALDGEEFSWDDPPVSGVRGEKQHPGNPINCRCISIPIFPEDE